jgi:hypothetical protein
MGDTTTLAQPIDPSGKDKMTPPPSVATIYIQCHMLLHLSRRKVPDEGKSRRRK